MYLLHHQHMSLAKTKILMVCSPLVIIVLSSYFSILQASICLNVLSKYLETIEVFGLVFLDCELLHNSKY